VRTQGAFDARPGRFENVDENEIATIRNDHVEIGGRSFLKTKDVRKPVALWLADFINRQRKSARSTNGKQGPRAIAQWHFL